MLLRKSHSADATCVSVSVIFHQYCRKLHLQAGRHQTVTDNLLRGGYHIVFALAQLGQNNTPVGLYKLAKPKIFQHNKSVK